MVEVDYLSQLFIYKYLTQKILANYCLVRKYHRTFAADFNKKA